MLFLQRARRVILYLTLHRFTHESKAQAAFQRARHEVLFSRLASQGTVDETTDFVLITGVETFHPMPFTACKAIIKTR
jgi:hypothetical protein